MTNDNQILSQKRAWRLAERRKGDRRKKDGSPEDRKALADTLRSGRHQYYCTCSICELNNAEDKRDNKSLMVAILIGLVLGVIMFFSGKAHAYSDDQYVNAIRHAEGTWTYGIKTIKCNSETECRRIALRTVHNNRIRFSTYGYRKYSTFISFLGSRYCPINAGNDPEGLNINWIANVGYWLRKDA